MPVFILSKIRQYKTIFFNTFYLSIIEFIKLVMPLIALPYIIKVVGVNKYGMIVFAQSVVAYFSIVVNFGIDILAVKRVAENRDRKNEIEKVIGGVLIIKGALFLFMLCLFTLLILIWGEARNHALLFYFAFLACLTEVIFVPWLFQGLEEMSFITFIKSTSILIYVGLLLLLIHRAQDYVYIPLLQSGSLLVVSMIGFLYMWFWKGFHAVNPGWRYIWTFFKGSFPMFLSRGSVIINNNMGKIVAGICLGTSEVAILDLAQKIIWFALTPGAMLNQAIYPHNARTKNRKTATRLLFLAVAFSLVVTGAIVIAAPYLVDFLGHGKLQEAVPLLRFFSPFIVIGTLSTYLGTPLLVAWGYPKPFNDSVFISTGILLVCYGFLGLTGWGSLKLFVLILMMAELTILLYRGGYCVKYKIIKA